MRANILFSLAIIVTIAACSGTAQPNPIDTSGTSRVATITISPSSLSLLVGRSTQLNVVLRDSAGNGLSGPQVSWSSSDTLVAQVSSTGLASAHKAGSAIIRAVSEGKSGSVPITVLPVPVAALSITPPSPSVQVGSTIQLTATALDSSGKVLSGRVVSWSSLNTNVATITASGGVATGVSAGTATIKAISEGVAAQVSLSVTTASPQPVSTVTVSLASSNLAVGQSTQASAVLKDANGDVLTGRTIAWSSSNQTVATVSGAGLVNALGAGTAQITATSETSTGAASLTVSSVQQAKIDTIFYDGFESGNFDKWQDGYNPQKHQIVTDPAGAVAGTHYLEATYPVGQDGGWLTTFFMPGYDSAYVRLYVRFEPTWTGSTKIFGLYGSRTDNQWSAFGQAGKCPTGTDFFAAMVVTDQSGATSGTTNPLRFYTYYPAMAREPDGVTCWGRYGDGTEQYNAPLQMTLGVWHKLEFWLKLNTIGNSDAVQQFWLDGQLKGSWSGIQFRSSSILEINSLQLSFSGSDTQVAHVFVDEVLVTKQKSSP